MPEVPIPDGHQGVNLVSNIMPARIAKAMKATTRTISLTAFADCESLGFFRSSLIPRFYTPESGGRKASCPSI